MKKTTETVPAEALKFHYADDASVCEFADAGEDGKSPVKIKARSRHPIFHWYWGWVIHDMAGMKLSKRCVPIDYCHNSEEVLGALEAFDTESGDLQTEGFVDAEDTRGAEVIRKGKMGVPYEASIFFDRRTIEAERLGEREKATVNGVTVKGPITIIRKWTLRGVAITPYGYDPRTSTRFSEDDCDVDVTLLSSEPDEGEETMSVEQTTSDAGQLSEGVRNIEQTQDQTPPAGATELGAEPSSEASPGDTGELSDDSGDETSSDPPADSTKLSNDEPGQETEPKSKTPPGQSYIEKFGLEKGSQYYARGLSMEAAATEHFQTVEQENTALRARLDAAQTGLGSEEPVSFSGDPSAATEDDEGGSGDDALDAFCANTKLPGARS